MEKEFFAEPQALWLWHVLRLDSVAEIDHWHIAFISCAVPPN